MRRFLPLLFPLILLGAGCGNVYVSGSSTASPGVVFSGTSGGMNAIIAPDFKTMNGQASPSFTLPQ